jgi:Ser/Thr protein kinase RdoA (MazF antagonist)
LENALFTNEACVLIDYERCGPGPAIYDLACYWRRHRETGRFADLVEGYRRVRPLSDAALKTIPAMAALRAIWVMGLPAHPRSRFGRDWLSDRTYFVDHINAIETLFSAKV